MERTKPKGKTVAQLSREVEGLRKEFGDLRNSLKAHAAAVLAAQRFLELSADKDPLPEEERKRKARGHAASLLLAGLELIKGHPEWLTDRGD